MQIAILNDTHCGVRNSSEIFLDYQAQFYDDVFFPYCEEHGIKQVLHLGDYYDHRKFINFKALNHNRKHFLNALRDKGMYMDIIPGNHDVYYKNTNQLNSLKELLGHYMNEVHIIMEPTVMDYDGCKIGLLPWICQENYQKSMEFIQTCSADILAAHLELNGFEYMKGVKATEGMDSSLFSRFEMVLSGHYHTRSNRGNIHYLGSQMEFFASDANDPKYFHVFDTVTRELTPVKNPHTLFEKVVYDDTKTDYNTFDVSRFNKKFVKIVVVNKSDSYIFDRFVDRVQSQNIYELKIAENFSEFLGESVQDESVSLEDTTTLLDTYVDAVETDLDKSKIKTQMRDLMTEAQALDFV